MRKIMLSVIALFISMPAIADEQSILSSLNKALTATETSHKSNHSTMIYGGKDLADSNIPIVDDAYLAAQQHPIS